MPGPTVQQLRDLMAARDEATQLDQRAKDAAATKKRLESEVHDALEGAGLSSVTQDIGAPWGRVQFVPNETVYADVFNEPAFLEWAEAHGYGETFVKQDVRRKALNQYVRRLLNTGRTTYPPGLAHRATRYVTATRKD